jgi:hypothetical protein
MKLTNHEWLRTVRWVGLLLMAVAVMGWESTAHAAVSTTTVQGTVYLANGNPATGTLVISWPAFTTAAGQLITADSMTVTVAPDGFASVDLAPNQGATPAGEYYTATYYLSDGTTNTEYWVVPAAAQATLGAIQAQVMPAAQAVQAVSKSYVDQSISELTGSLLAASGGTLSGELTLCCDPVTPMEAADKHYVDATFALAAPLTGATMTGPLTSVKLGALYQVDQFPGSDFGAKLGACLSGLDSTYGGTCDARNFTGAQSMGSNLSISTGNATVLLPCATISTANQIVVTAGTRNVSLQGCALRGASTASGSQGGTVFLYSGTKTMVQVGDPTYAADTLGFHLDNAVINTTVSSSTGAQGLAAYRTQELDLESLYFLGNSNQTGMTLDGTGNYTGGTFLDNAFNGFQTAVNAVGHQTTNPATTDWLNASTFVRLHIDCPTSNGSPISGSYGINLQQGDGNTFTGGDVEGCSTALHLGANAQNNTIIGLRNENSTSQIVADTGSEYNSWITGGTMFTGKLTDNGTRNSFLDTFHRSFNGVNGDWYGSQNDATVTNHYRLGIGSKNERGLLDRYQTDYGYRWTMGLSDATAGEQFYQIQDELNNVYRLSIGQYNNGQSSTNNQTVINAAGTGAIVLNGSNNSGTGGVVFGSGGANETTVATINNAGSAQFNGTLQVGGATTLASTPTVKNQTDAEIDATLWAGLTKAQKESFIYKDWDGSSQWYMVKDEHNNWMLNSATGGLNSFKAYQSTNSGDTYVNASNPSGVVRVNYESGSGTGFNVYGGNSNTLYASFTGATVIRFPGLASSSGYNCLQTDNSGYITNTGAACGTGSTNGTVNAGTSGQIAYYNGTGTAISGTNTVSITAGGTGASTSAGALANLGGAALTGAAFTGPVRVSTTLSAANMASIGPRYDVTQFGAKGDGSTDDTAAIQAAFTTCWAKGGIVEFPGPHTYVVSSTINAYDGCQIEGTLGSSSNSGQLPKIAWGGPASAAGTAYSVTGFTLTTNTATATPAFPLISSSPQNRIANYLVTATATNSLSAGQWVEFSGFSTTAGRGLNRCIGQVASATGTSFVLATPCALSITSGTFADAGTATTVSVVLAFDAMAMYQQSVSNITIGNKTSVNPFNVGVYYGSSVDTGTHVLNAQVSNSLEYGFYFARGGINVDFDKGWRADGNQAAGIYWRVSGNNSFGIANGTVDNDICFGCTTPTSGAAVMLDNSACIANSSVYFTSRNIKVELNTSVTPGLGAFTLLSCPSNANGVQFFLNFDTTWVAAAGNIAGFHAPSIVMSPPDDEALVLSAVNSAFGAGTGTDTTVPFEGIPALSRGELNSAGNGGGYYSALFYAPPFASGKFAGTTTKSPMELMGDVNVGQLWQDGIQASAFLYSDTSYAALPNGTTLYAGQILAPPAYWSGANGKRYAADVVYQTGTTGTPNSGNTTCTGTSGTSVLTCSSATDLSAGQRITVGTDTNKAIQYVDATNSSVVLVNLTSNLASTYSTAKALSFSAPVLGPEMQFATKSAAAPTVLAWSQGDMEQNSGATANGVAAWVNVAAGTPGTWAGVPLGNSSGQIAPTQITTPSMTINGSSCTLGSSCILPSAGVNTPVWLQNLATGVDGAYEATAANCTASSPCNLSSFGDKYFSSFTIDSGAYVYSNLSSSGAGLVIHSTGACNLYGTITVNGTVNTWPSSNVGIIGGSSGGSGGGTVAGTAGVRSNYLPVSNVSALNAALGGNAGAASGGNGGNGSSVSLSWQRALANGGAGIYDGLTLTGATGVQGANNGGSGGGPGGSFVAICESIDGTGGVIDASGAAGNPSAANNSGAGSGGGGGVVILSSQAAVTNWPAVYVAGGPGGLATVPEAVATSGSCTKQPKATLGVTSGALNGACTVVQAGAGCGTGTGVTWNILGGGGTVGTAVVNPTWSGGALASCTVTPGTSTGYTAATYTTAGTGGDGGNGWAAEYQGW